MESQKSEASLVKNKHFHFDQWHLICVDLYGDDDTEELKMEEAIVLANTSSYNTSVVK